MTRYHFYLLLTLSLNSCSQTTNDALHDAIISSKESTSISYVYTSIWDTRINKTITSSTAEIILSRLSESIHSYGFHVKTENEDFVFDGSSYREFYHTDKKIIFHEKQDIASDSTYADITYVSTNPWTISKLAFKQTPVHTNGSYYIYEKKRTKPSFVDSSKTVTYIDHFYLPIGKLYLSKIINTTLIDGDTAQVLTHQFDNVKLRSEGFDFSSLNLSQTHVYQEVSNREEQDGKTAQTIQKDAILNQTVFMDIYSKPQDIIGRPKSVIMFSFIGCTACEIALLKMRKKNFAFDEEVTFYYSSPRDHEQAIRRYTQEKKYPFVTFSSESKMNDQFKVISYPTFFVVDSLGKIDHIYDELSEELSEILFE